LENRLVACTALLLPLLVFFCSEARAQCSLNIQSSISSGWNKQGVSYTVDKNTLKIKVAEGGKNDTDSIYIGSIRGCSTLTISVPQISGQYPWGGKAIGFSFANDLIQPHQWGNQASFPPPRGRAIEDGFIKTSLSNNTELVYDIDNSSKTMHIGAKVFIGGNNVLELQFSAQPPAREPQSSAPQASRTPRFDAQQTPREPRLSASQMRPTERYTDDDDEPWESPANSCSASCHEPRGRHREYVFARGFSIPYRRSACPDGRH